MGLENQRNSLKVTSSQESIKWRSDFALINVEKYASKITCFHLLKYVSVLARKNQSFWRILVSTYEKKNALELLKNWKYHRSICVWWFNSEKVVFPIRNVTLTLLVPHSQILFLQERWHISWLEASQSSKSCKISRKYCLHNGASYLGSYGSVVIEIQHLEW